MTVIIHSGSDLFTSLGHAVRDTSLPEAERYRLACHRAFVDEVSNWRTRAKPSGVLATSSGVMPSSA